LNRIFRIGCSAGLVCNAGACQLANPTDAIKSNGGGNSTTTLAAVLGTLGGLLLIALIVAAIVVLFIINKRKTAEAEANNNKEVPMIVPSAVLPSGKLIDYKTKDFI
jgi:hypothetical protein